MWRIIHQLSQRGVVFARTLFRYKILAVLYVYPD